MKDDFPRYTLRISQILLDKLGYIAEYEGRTKNKEIEQLIKKRIAEFEDETKKEINSACEEFIKSVRDNYDSDIVGIGLEAKKLFWTNKEFEEYNWRKKFSEYDISVDTDFKIRRTGLTMREKE